MFLSDYYSHHTVCYLKKRRTLAVVTKKPKRDAFPAMKKNDFHCVSCCKMN